MSIWEWNLHAHVQNAFSQTTQMFVHSCILVMFCGQNAMDPAILAWCAEHLQENERHNPNSQKLKLSSCAICLTKTQIIYTKAKRKVTHMKITKENTPLQFFQFGLWLQFFSSVLINKFLHSFLLVLYVTSLYSSKGEGIYYLENFKPQKIKPQKTLSQNKKE